MTRDRGLRAAAVVGLAMALVGCASASVSPSAPGSGAASAGPSEPAASGGDGGGGALVLTSSAFDEGAPIPEVYSCDGDQTSPPLEWSGTPDGTVAYALIVDDPDAGGFVHWVVGNISAMLANFPEGFGAELPDEAAQGENGAGGIGWLGMCPPSGTHTYVFTLYALSEPAGVGPGVTASELLDAIEGKVLDEAVLTGTYTR
jgi:Raf kinase inhibitor-like YbhB/YbcL family protein